jgi:hypothetical protein
LHQGYYLAGLFALFPPSSPSYLHNGSVPENKRLSKI